MPPHPVPQLLAGRVAASLDRLPPLQSGEIVNQLAGRTVPLTRRRPQALRDNRRQVDGNLAPQLAQPGGFRPGNARQHRHGSLARVRWAPGQGREDHRPHSVEIAGGAHFPQPQPQAGLLGRHVGRSPHRQPLLGGPHPHRLGLGQAEVGDLGLKGRVLVHRQPIVPRRSGQQHIRWLEIAVDQPQGMHGGHSLGQLPGQSRCLRD